MADTLIAGVDEAGRGPLAGPVVAAAVILDPNIPITGLADSKKLKSAQRAVLCAQIMKSSLTYAIGVASSEEIDCLNILQATLLAMRRAVLGLYRSPTHLEVDGNHLMSLTGMMGLISAEAIVRGDSTRPVISAASIIAKVHRDTLMIESARRFPEYGFDIHKGYPTATHLAALRAKGVCAEHRRSFRPVRNLCSP